MAKSTTASSITVSPVTGTTATKPIAEGTVPDEYYRLGPAMIRALRRAHTQWVTARMDGLLDPSPSPPPAIEPVMLQALRDTPVPPSGAVLHGGKGTTGKVALKVEAEARIDFSHYPRPRSAAEEIRRRTLETYRVPGPMMGKPVFEGHYDERQPQALPRQARQQQEEIMINAMNLAFHQALEGK